MARQDRLNKVPKRFGNRGFDHRNKRRHQPYPTGNPNYDLDSLMFTPPPITPAISDSALHEHVTTPFTTLSNHAATTADDALLHELDLARLELNSGDNTGTTSGPAQDIAGDSAMGTRTRIIALVLLLIYMILLAQVSDITASNDETHPE